MGRWHKRIGPHKRFDAQAMKIRGARPPRKKEESGARRGPTGPGTLVDADEVADSRRDDRQQTKHRNSEPPVLEVGVHRSGRDPQ